MARRSGFCLVILVSVCLIAGCGGGSSAPSDTLGNALHQIHFLDGLDRSESQYLSEGDYGLVTQTRATIREAERYLEDNTDTVILGEACDTITHSHFCRSVMEG